MDSGRGGGSGGGVGGGGGGQGAPRRRRFTIFLSSFCGLARGLLL